MRLSESNYPLFQESIWQELLGDGPLSASYRKNRALFNIIFVPYTLIFFAFLPAVVSFDVVFRNADLLFVTPEALRERAKQNRLKGRRGKDDPPQEERVELEELRGAEENRTEEMRVEPENLFFRFFRSQIHTKMLRIIMHHWSQLVFAITLFLVVWNPYKTDENRMHHWYNYLAGFCSVFLLLDGLRLHELVRSSWCLFLTHS